MGLIIGLIDLSSNFIFWVNTAKIIHTKRKKKFPLRRSSDHIEHKWFIQNSFKLYIWYKLQSTINILIFSGVFHWFHAYRLLHAHKKVFCALEKHMHTGIFSHLHIISSSLIYYNQINLCTTAILLWRKWENGCTWINREMWFSSILRPGV